jgi:hypothetical protein
MYFDPQEQTLDPWGECSPTPTLEKNSGSSSGLPDISWYNTLKREKYTKWPENTYTKRPYDIPDGRNIFQKGIKCTNIFLSKALKKYF